MPSERPIKLTIAALGGQGGGVLANWLIGIAESEGYLAQTTSVPGVAQRTGATIYYLEFFPQAAAAAAGRDPIMALMPVSGDVDCVLASELAEAARAIQRGLVTRDRTTLIASSHRSYAISEKSAMGDGAANEEELIELVRSQAKRVVLFDMDAMAESHHSVISSVMLGALGGSGVLPFRKAAFEAAIKKGGIAVSTNLAAFEDAWRRAEGQDAPGADAGEADLGPSAALSLGGTIARETVASAADPLGTVPAQARSPKLQPLLDRVRRFAAPVQKIVLEGVRRAIDYQDPEYAKLYLDRLEQVAGLDGMRGVRGGGDFGGGARVGNGNEEWSLTEATARSLALWMTFEDTIRVADLKTRSTRFTRVRDEIRADAGQLFGITEFMKPRVTEIAGTLPAGLGRWLLRSPGMNRLLTRWTGGKQIRTGTVTGFLMLHLLGGLKRWRRGTLRFHEENARIEQWLGRIERVAATNYALAVELARAQRLVKGYGDTHERGWRNFSALVDKLDELAPRADGAAVFARLQTAALADEEGKALARELAEISSVAVVKFALDRARA
ncbi:MAG TPA: indolepyruvate oxidoreductase subunit beta family protein [Steroidobacteraceae bacterium]|nr:indolepyruvate oxidoreductase subunit beta family protein [Steroidobacteraceae bacterium]